MTNSASSDNPNNPNNPSDANFDSMFNGELAYTEKDLRVAHDLMSTALAELSNKVFTTVGKPIPLVLSASIPTNVDPVSGTATLATIIRANCPDQLALNVVREANNGLTKAVCSDYPTTDTMQ